MRVFFLMLLLTFSSIVTAQRRLYDPTIVSQEKRQVFESWGDWRPYGKWRFGIQTNFNYATVWGWLAPARNRRYKKGGDIRPLKPDGIEMQRLGEVKLQEEQTKQIKVEIDSLYKRNMQDFAHWTPLTVDADPLWLLYYKRMLRPLNDFPDNPSDYRQWGFKDDDTYQVLKQTGGIDFLQKKLDLLKDKYKVSRSVAMPRGKRFIMYHECLLDWRKFKEILSEHKQRSNLLLEYKSLFDKTKNIINSNRKTDVEIVRQVINDYKKIEEKHEE